MNLIRKTKFSFSSNQLLMMVALVKDNTPLDNLKTEIGQNGNLTPYEIVIEGLLDDMHFRL